MLKDGTRIPLRQPGQSTAPPRLAHPTSLPPAASFANPRAPATPATNRPFDPLTGGPGLVLSPQASVVPYDPLVLPPVRLSIPGIGSDLPVVLSNGINLPRFKAVGWLIGSAYPGTPGNMVLFGHLDGQYATLSRLKELRPGVRVTVSTKYGEYRYWVRSSWETTPEDVGVMAPTESATLTLITCSGRWDNSAGMYDRRLIVVADLAGAE